MSPILISVVMPTLDEAGALPARAAEIHSQEPPWEWWVVDGGSTDGTQSLARSLGAQVLEGPRGRGPQLASGARAASGEAVLFLHADTELPAGAVSAIRSALDEPSVVGGNFRLRFGNGSPVDRLFDACVLFQQRALGAFFGDSAIFCRRGTLVVAGGVPELPLFEDLELVRRLRAHGRLVQLPLSVRTSDRRYRGREVRTVLRWAALAAAHAVGTDPRWLARFYAPHRGSPASQARPW
jgi:rSAM/selenodomain-associated transferase 2